MKPSLLVLIPLKENARAAVAEHFEPLHAPVKTDWPAVFASPEAAGVRVVLTNGAVGMTAEQMAALPKLELVCALGAGYENIDIEEARRRGIAVANGAGTNDDCVADHAFSLLLAAVRSVVRLDAYCRAGGWRDALAPIPNVSGKRMGVLGLGTIGRKIVKRALGFDMEIGYHNRRRIDDVPHAYFGSPVELAEWSDYLMVVTPGGAATRHLVDAKVLAALGPKGFLVNVARGSVVDTAALAVALRSKTIAGAGLDVYESEPEPPAELLDLDNVVLTPHVAGMSPEATGASVQRFIDNATRHFAGQPMISPV